ncbi:hypothetical protein [Tenacibaculum ovolyticum]|uniref:hypothetical protein n=1 Tax=Tenacibaculum ovolyticum TaxID=104270 RepID=UPI0007EE1955|nr:hypothetical protein [Tenacibaculum ovolyticum]
MYPKNYFEAKNFKTRRGTCFVIIPFAGKFDEVYLTFRDTLQSKKIKLISFRGDDIYEPYILESLLRKII